MYIYIYIYAEQRLLSNPLAITKTTYVGIPGTVSQIEKEQRKLDMCIEHHRYKVIHKDGNTTASWLMAQRKDP